MGHTLRDRAVALARKGYVVAPVHFTRDEHGKKSRPHFPLGSWKETASATAQIVASWPWERASHILVDCERSGVVVIDVDRPGLGEWSDLSADFDPGDQGFSVDTESGGQHHYYRADPELPVYRSVGSLAEGIDVCGLGSIAYVYGELPPVAELPRMSAEVRELIPAPASDLALPEAPYPPRYAAGSQCTMYGRIALEGEKAALLREWDLDRGKFNHTLNAAAWNLGRLTAGGELATEYAVGALVRVLESLGAPADQYRTLDSGFDSGFRFPRCSEDTDPPGEDDDEALEVIPRSRWSEYLKPPRWLVKDLLPAGAVVQLVGASGSGKTMVAVDLAESVAHGRRWLGRATKPGSVVYVAAESPHSLRIRAEAWEAYYGADLSDRLGMVRSPLQVMHHEWQGLVEYVVEHETALLILDTQVRVAAEIDENKANEMQLLFNRLSRLADATGVTIVAVHHTGHGDAKRGRGSTAAHASADAVISVSKKDGIITLDVLKQRDAEHISPVMGRLVPRELSAVFVKMDAAFAPEEA